MKNSAIFHAEIYSSMVGCPFQGKSDSARADSSLRLRWENEDWETGRRGGKETGSGGKRRLGDNETV